MLFVCRTNKSIHLFWFCDCKCKVNLQCIYCSLSIYNSLLIMITLVLILSYFRLSSQMLIQYLKYVIKEAEHKGSVFCHFDNLLKHCLQWVESHLNYHHLILLTDFCLISML